MKRGKHKSSKNQRFRRVRPILAKRGQIWVETMVYTLIAFALIGLVLTFVKPKIQETQDKGIIEQSVGILEDIDSVIRTLGGPGNQRVLEVGLNKGTLSIDGVNDKIQFKIESRYVYSQPGEDVNVGGIIANTQKKGNVNEVTLIKNYSGEYNITLQNRDELKEVTRASTPYKFIISDKGGSVINIDITN